MALQDILIRLRLVKDPNAAQVIAEQGKDIEAAAKAATPSVQTVTTATKDQTTATKDQTTATKAQTTAVSDLSRQQGLQRELAQDMQRLMRGDLLAIPSLIRHWREYERTIKGAGDQLRAFQLGQAKGGEAQNWVNNAKLALGNLPGILAAGFAGWQAGLKIQSALWKRFVEDLDEAPLSLRRTREEFDKLNDARLDKITAAVTSISQGLKNLVTDLDAASKRADIVSKIGQEIELAQLAKANLPEDQRAAAEKGIRARYATADAQRRIDELQAQLAATQRSAQETAAQFANISGATGSEVERSESERAALRARSRATGPSETLGRIAGDNRRRLAGLCRDASVLDLCCYTGGFGLCARLLGGAKEVTASASAET